MNFSISSKKKLDEGFSLVEVLIAVAIFTLISLSSYNGFVKITQGIQILKVKNAAVSLANERIEIIRNMPYEDVGIIGGLPAGKIVRDQIIEREGMDFHVNTTIRDIDDPFDGLIGGEPNDLSPADYKLVEFAISCSGCIYDDVIKYYARISPLNLETQGNNGALFVRVYDSNGEPIQGADVHIENNQQAEPIVIDETTNITGMFQIVDAPTGTEAYEISVTKEGYSTDKTYTVGEPENPAPNRPHANVASGQVTQVSFYIDKLSSLGVYTKTSTCSAVPNVDFNIRGSKEIGYGVYKYNVDDVTNSSGYINIDSVEWDSYIFTITDSNWHLLGTSPVLPVDVSPDSDQAVDLILTEKEPNALQILVENSESGLPVSGADVTIFNASNDITLVTGQGFVTQTDWSGGPNQEFYSDNARFFSSDGGIEYQDPAGDLKLSKFGDDYINIGVLESSIFDMGTETNFGHIFWNPVAQDSRVGTNGIRVQVSTNSELTATTTWDFVGPDGTSGSYYTTPGEELASIHSNDRYLKYKVYLSTADTSYTPILSNISFTIMTECTPPGQILFTDLDSGEYTIEASHADYQDYLLGSYIIDGPWQTQKIILIPNEE